MHSSYGPGRGMPILGPQGIFLGDTQGSSHPPPQYAPVMNHCMAPLHLHPTLPLPFYENVKRMVSGTSQRHFPKGIFQLGQLPKWQHPKCAIFQIGCQVQQMATQNVYTFCTAVFTSTQILCLKKTINKSDNVILKC